MQMPLFWIEHVQVLGESVLHAQQSRAFGFKVTKIWSIELSVNLFKMNQHDFSDENFLISSVELSHKDSGYLEKWFNYELQTMLKLFLKVQLETWEEKTLR